MRPIWKRSYDFHVVWKGTLAQIHNHRCHLTSAVRSQLVASLISWYDLCLDQSLTAPCLSKPGVGLGLFPVYRVSLAVSNLTTKVRAGAEWNRRRELHQPGVIHLPIWQSAQFSLCLLLFLHDSAWRHTCLSVFVRLHRRPRPGPNWDERPCHVWRDLNHSEDEQWSELPSDILTQHSAENKILE